MFTEWLTWFLTVLLEVLLNVLGPSDLLSLLGLSL